MSPLFKTFAQVYAKLFTLQLECLNPRLRSNGTRDKRQLLTSEWFLPECLALKHESRIVGHFFNPVCGLSMMEQFMLCAGLPMSSLAIP